MSISPKRRRIDQEQMSLHSKVGLDIFRQTHWVKKLSVIVSEDGMKNRSSWKSLMSGDGRHNVLNYLIGSRLNTSWWLDESIESTQMVPEKFKRYAEFKLSFIVSHDRSLIYWLADSINKKYCDKGEDNRYYKEANNDLCCDLGQIEIIIDPQQYQFKNWSPCYMKERV